MADAASLPASPPVTATLRNGTVITLRELRPDDRERVAAFVHGLEPHSIYMRLFSPIRELTEKGLDRIMRMEPEREEVVVATIGAGAEERIIGSARFVALSAPPGGSAEVAFTVEEDFHGLGIAGRLFAHLIARARACGFATLEAEVLPGNKAMLAVFARSGLPMDKRREDGTVHLTLDLRDG
jgi:RimJ/RimL family protein N-acetyltransferase